MGHCKEEECSLDVWGQNVNIPVPWTSDTLYLSWYKDCGDSVIGLTQLIHNDTNMYAGGDMKKYINTSLGGSLCKYSLVDFLKSSINWTLLRVSDTNRAWGVDR